MGANATEPGDRSRHRVRPGQPPTDLLRVPARALPAPHPVTIQPQSLRGAGSAVSPSNVNTEIASLGEVFEPADVQWAPEEVVSAGSSTLRRLSRNDANAVAVTSALRREGRSTIALGIALAQRNLFGRRTVLIDLDFNVEGSSLARQLGIRQTPGLAELLQGQAALDECLVWPSPHLGLLVAGDCRGDPSLLARFRANSVLNDLRHAGYAVVADLPPLPPSGHADAVVDQFSAILLVVRAGATPVGVVRAAAEMLAEPPLVVLNRKKSAVPRWLRGPLGG
jgi:Mrp family chromosome partitioning ATPase